MAITQTYFYPVAGTVPPSVAQALAVNKVIATVAWGDTDTAALLTHNFNVTQPEVPNTLTPGNNPTTYTGALGPSTVFPIVTVSITGPATVLPIITVALTNANAITLTKVSAAGSNCTATVTIDRPWSGAV